MLPYEQLASSNGGHAVGSIGVTPGLHRPASHLVGAGDLSAVLNQLFIALVEVDFQGRVISANERFCALIERSPEAVLLRGMRLAEAVYAADAVRVDRLLAQLAAGAGPLVCEMRLATADRRLTWVDVAATALTDAAQAPASAVLVLTDISQRKRAEARAAETQRRFREVADAAPVFIWTSGTDRRRRHTWVNRQWAEFRGRPMEAELGSGWMKGVHEDDVGGCLAAYRVAFDTRQLFKAEYRLQRFDGDYRWMLDTGNPMHDEHGRFVGYIGSSIDITDRKVAERERESLLASERAARSDAERANRLKDEFLSILSHELRTPLNAVLGWVHLLRSSARSAVLLERGLNVIERNARLQGRMVDDLLDMGGVIAGKMRLETRGVSLARIIDGATESLQPAFLKKGVALRRIVPDEDGLVDGDPHRLHQIIWNLLSNALKFTAAGGEVVVELGHHGADAQITVRDNGQGIAEEFLPFVFERFRQGDPSTRRSHSGLGIGLALVKSLTELHGGDVRATSDGPGCGAAFTVRLPLIGPRAATATDSAGVAQSLKGEPL